jgi:hypothetical protein
MQEACYCGRTGDLRNREPVLSDNSRWALRCPDCSRLDYLHWLSDEAGLVLWGEAKERWEERSSPATSNTPPRVEGG